VSRWLILAKYYPTGGPETQICFTSTFGFTSLPTSSPASKEFASRIEQALDLQRDLVSQADLIGRTTAGQGTIDVKNSDGLLDALYDAGWDGREVLAFWGDESLTITSGYTQVLKGTGIQPEGGRKIFRLNLRDRIVELDVPLQASTYSGAGGLNGGADLTGKLLPKLFGTVRNVPCVLVDPVKLIYQISDAACTPSEVRDRGLALTMAPDVWSNRTSGTANRLRDACAHPTNGVVVAVGDSGTIIRSTDAGITWAAAATPSFGATNIFCVAFDLIIGKWVAGGASGKLAQSSDGNTWVQITGGSNPFGGAETINDIQASGAGTIMAVGSLGISARSTNGTSFTSKANNYAGAAIEGVGYDGVGLWLMIGNTADVDGSVDDGNTWARYAAFTAIHNTTGAHRIAFGRDTWIVFAPGDGSIYSSADGKVWTLRYTAPSPFAIYNGAYSRVLGWVGACGTGTLTATQVLLSPDGIVWTMHLRFASGGDPARAVAVDGSGTVTIVADGGGIQQPGTFGTYPNTTDLQDNSLKPSAGTFKYYSGASGTYIRLGGPPAGLVTADAASSINTATTITQTLLGFAGLSSGDWSAADFTQLTTDQPAVLELWTGPDDHLTVSDGVEYIIKGVGGWWGFDRTGIFRCAIIKDPSSGSSAATITDPAPGLTGDIVGDGIQCLPLQGSTAGQSLASYQTVLQYSKNYSVQTSDLANRVTDSARTGFAKLYYDTTVTDASVQTKHKLARRRVVQTCFSSATDVATECTRLQALWGADRKYYEFALPISATNLQRDLGQVFTLKSPRFSGLSSGKKHLIVKVHIDAKANRMNMGAWG
jgi:hypothetical protein